MRFALRWRGLCGWRSVQAVLSLPCGPCVILSPQKIISEAPYLGLPLPEPGSWEWGRLRRVGKGRASSPGLALRLAWSGHLPGGGFVRNKLYPTCVLLAWTGHWTPKSACTRGPEPPGLIEERERNQQRCGDCMEGSHEAMSHDLVPLPYRHPRIRTRDAGPSRT